MNSEIVIVGAGGLAKEVLGYIYYDINKGGAELNIKGIIVDNHSNDISLPYDLLYLGSIKNYIPRKNEVFLVCIGENPGRKKVIDLLEGKGANFYSYISSLAYVNPTAKIGKGIIITPFCIVNANADLGDHVLMGAYSAIGHDSKVGDHAVLYPYAAINGNCTIGKNLIMGTKATVFPKINMGDNCVITTHSYVKKNKGKNRFIHQKTKEIDLENRF